MSLRSMFAQAHEDAKAIRKRFEDSGLFKAIQRRRETLDTVGARNGVIAANLLYLWCSHCALYTHLAYIVPYVFRDCDDWTIYYLKVLVAFSYVQSTANWICAKCYSSVYKITNDKPDLQKTLWDTHSSVTIHMQNGNGHYQNGHLEDDTDLKLEKKNLSWKWCDSCQANSPPRSHHCKICKSCILKRDHHCFILGTCIGHYNQRYFFILSFYMTVTCWPALYLTYIYLRDTFIATHYSHYFLPVTLYQYLWGGSIPFHHMCMISNMNLLWIGAAFGLGFFSGQIVLLYTGKTAYEFLKDIRVKSTASVNSHLRSVFGDFWFLNFFFPAVLLFRQSGDGTEWDDMRTF